MNAKDKPKKETRNINLNLLKREYERGKINLKARGMKTKKTEQSIPAEQFKRQAKKQNISLRQKILYCFFARKQS